MGRGSSHGRRVTNVGGGTPRGGEDSFSTPPLDRKPSNQIGGSNKRAGPIKKPVQKEVKKEGGEINGAEKTSGGKDKEQDGPRPPSVKQEAPPLSQNAPALLKDESKPKNGGKERPSGRGSKDVDPSSSGFPAPPSRRDRNRSFERGGGGPHHPGAPTKGGRGTRGRGGEFYGRGRAYRGTYTASAGPAVVGRGRMGGRSGRDYRPSVSGPHHQEPKVDGAGRHGQDRSQHNPARARNQSETRSEGSEYEEIPKRRRERGSETGSDSGGSDPGHSDRDNQKPPNKNGSDHVSAAGNVSSTTPRVSQARVFTPRGVPSRRGRGGGGGGGGGNAYRSSSNMGGMTGGHRLGPGSGSHTGSARSTGRKQQGPPQSFGPKDPGRGGGAGEKKDKGGGPTLNQGTNPQQSSLPATTPHALGSTENGGLMTQQPPTNPPPNSVGPTPLQPTNRGPPPGGFERPPRRRRHGRSQHQQDKPPRFRRLKERENAARINGGVGVIGGGRPSSPSLNSVQGSNGAPGSAPVTGNAPNHSTAPTTNSHHHYSQGSSAPTHPHHGAKSPDFTNQNSDQANEEWETASESSDFTEFRDREGGGGGGKPFTPHHHPHLGRGGGGSLADREMTSKDPSANKRSFSSQRPGMERQNRRVNGGGGRGPRGPPGGGPGMPANGGGNRGEKRGNWPSPKNRK